MIHVLSSSDATKEEKDKVRRELKAEKNHAQNAQNIQNRKMENEDQLQWFKKIVDLHQSEYTNFSIQNRIAASATGYGTQQAGADVEMNDGQAPEYAAGGDMQDIQAAEGEEKKLKNLFAEFTLDSYWRSGLELETGNDDAELAAAGDHRFVDSTYWHKVHRIQIEEALLPGQPIPQTTPFDPKAHINTQVKLGGQRSYSHCLPMDQKCVQDIELNNLKEYHVNMQSAKPTIMPSESTIPLKIKCDAQFYSSLNFA